MSLEVTLGIRNEQFKTGLEEAREKVGELKSELGGMFVGAIGIAGFGEMIAHAVEYADKIGDLKERFDVNTTSLQQFGSVAERNGSSLEAVAKGFNKLEIAKAGALRGNVELQQAFANLGVSLNDLRSMTPDELMLKIGARSMNAADMVKVMGKSALELRVTLGKLADGSEELGAAMSEGTINKLKEAADRVKLLQQQIVVGTGEALAYLDRTMGRYFRWLGGGSVDGGEASFRAMEDDPRLDMQDNLNHLIDKEINLRNAGRKVQADQVAEQRKQLQEQMNALDHPEKKKPTADDEETAAGGEAKLSFEEKLADLEKEAARKKLLLAEQLAAVNEDIANLNAARDQEKGPEARLKLENEILEKTKERISLEERSRAESEKNEKARQEYSAKRDAAQKAYREGNYEALPPQEKQSDLLSRLADLKKKLESGDQRYTSPLVLAGNIELYNKMLKEARSMAGNGTSGNFIPTFDENRQAGGGLAGVSYAAQGDSRDALDALKAIQQNTAEWLNKNFKLDIPQSTFNGGEQ